MLRRFRRLFIVATALGYGLLGGGPLLWALSLSTAPVAGVCVMGGCTCKVDGLKAGKACCCKAKADLVKKFPELAQDPLFAPRLPKAPLPGVSISAGTCGSEGPAAWQALPPLQLHTLLQFRWEHNLGLRSAQDSLLAGPLLYVPEPPTPIPD